MGPVLVFGHRNPDNDSICSAVAYAHLKNLTDPASVYVPARLGPVPRETAYVFDRFGVQLPEQIDHVRARVRDIMTESPLTVRADETLRDAGALMREHGVRSLPVVDGHGVVAGLVSERVLAERYLDEHEVTGFSARPVAVARLVRVLDGELLAGAPETELAGDIALGVREPESMRDRIAPGDTLIVGDRQRTQPLALEAGAAALVLTGGAAPAHGVLELARDRGAAVIGTQHDAYSAARLMALAHTVGEVMDRDVLSLGPETLASEAAEEILGSAHRCGVVVDEQGVPEGIVTRTDLARPRRRRVLLVDHNEVAQSAEGIEDARVVEIVDHHRVGDVQSIGPILFLNMPVGATATIVASRYRELGVELPEAMAGILLGAVLTDTVLLKSPTTTDVDRETVEWLAARAHVDPTTFGLEVFRARSAGQVFDAASVVASDLKEFRIGESRVAVAQYETVELSPIMDRIDEVTAAAEALRVREGYDTVVLMLTDIVREGSEIVAVGATRPVERALGVSLADGHVWMPGVLSRKKQIAARLVEAAGA